VSKTFEFAEKLFKTGEIGTDRLSKLGGTVLLLFKRELLIENLFKGFQNWGDCRLPVFLSSWCTYVQ
jgi:hypothetical protein